METNLLLLIACLMLLTGCQYIYQPDSYTKYRDTENMTFEQRLAWIKAQPDYKPDTYGPLRTMSSIWRLVTDCHGQGHVIDNPTVHVYVHEE